MVLSILNGLRFETLPATVYCSVSVTQCKIMTIMNTMPKTERILATWPARVIFAKTPTIWMGRSGIIT